METLSFTLQISIEDILLGKDIEFEGKKIEVWKKETDYDELIGTCSTDSSANADFTFQLTSETTVELPSVYFKIYDGNDVIIYSLPGSDLLYVELTEGENDITLLVDLKEKYTGVTNERILCQARITDNDDKPYSDLEVLVSIRNADTLVQQLGTARTNQLGFIAFSFIKDKHLTALINGDTPNLQFRFEYYGKSDELVDQQNKLFSSITDFGKLIILKINLTLPEPVTSVGISNLASNVGFSIPSNLQTFFTSNNINTLRDIRSFGGLKRKTELTVTDYDQPTILRLDAHAQLETISSDFVANDYIISQGYNAVYKIAKTTQSRFVKDMSGEQVGDYNAAKYYRIACAHHRLYTNYYFQKIMESKREGGS